jgi:hypothetical protein
MISLKICAKVRKVYARNNRVDSSLYTRRRSILELDMIRQFLRLFPYVRKLEDQLRQALCGEISLESFQVKDGNIDLKLKSRIVPLVAEAFYELLNEMKAPNYIEFSLDHLEAHETILVTVQKKSGKSPHEMRVEAEKEVQYWEEKYRNLLNRGDV